MVSKKLKPVVIVDLPEISDGGAYSRISVSVDQSLSSTGIACRIPILNLSDVDIILPYIYEFLPEKENKHRLGGYGHSLRLIADDLKHAPQTPGTIIYPIYAANRWTSGPRKAKNLVLGAIVVTPSGLSLIATARVCSEASREAEWINAGHTSALVASILSKLAAFAGERRIPEMNVSLECLAMGGSKLTARILPILGIVWAMMFQAISRMISPSSVLISTYEFQISSWKKAFTGDGRSDKEQVEARVLSALGLSPNLYSFETSDESDALAMNILLAALHSSANPSTGRIRPI